MTKETKLHYGFLDTLRTIAIVLVLLRHSIRPFLPGTGGDATIYDEMWAPIKNLMANGWVGVDLFFLLSGFLIAQPFLSSQRVSIKNFYRNRILRIFPAYFVVLTLVIIGAFPYYYAPTGNLIKSLILHVFFMQDYTGSDLNVVFWSLAVEVKFYIIAPFILIFASRYVQLGSWIKAYISIISIVLVMPIFRFFAYNAYGEIQDYYEFFRTMRSPFHMNIDGLFFGVLLALIFKQIRAEQSFKKWLGIIFIIASSGALLYLTSHDFLAEISIFDAVFQPFLISLIFFTIALSGMLYLSAHSTNPLSRWAAKLSYSIYLVHWPLIPLCLFIPETLGIGSAYNSIGASLVFMGALCGISVVLAFIIYHFIESPFLKLKRQI